MNREEHTLKRTEAFEVWQFEVLQFECPHCDTINDVDGHIYTATTKECTCYYCLENCEVKRP